jgi:hypothetical protein
MYDELEYMRPNSPGQGIIEAQGEYSAEEAGEIGRPVVENVYRVSMRRLRVGRKASLTPCLQALSPLSIGNQHYQQDMEIGRVLPITRPKIAITC